MAHRFGLVNHIIASWLGELCHDDHSIKGKGPNLDAASIFCLGDACDWFSPLARLPAA